MNWLEKLDKHDKIQLLGELMSSCSEDCYHADWLEGTEYIIPELTRRIMIHGHSLKWGQGYLGRGLAEILQKVADSLGGWVNLDEAGKEYVFSSPFPIPSKYLTDIDSHS